MIGPLLVVVFLFNMSHHRVLFALRVTSQLEFSLPTKIPSALAIGGVRAFLRRTAGSSACTPENLQFCTKVDGIDRIHYAKQLQDPSMQNAPEHFT